MCKAYIKRNMHVYTYKNIEKKKDHVNVVKDEKVDILNSNAKNGGSYEKGTVQKVSSLVPSGSLCVLWALDCNFFGPP